MTQEERFTVSANPHISDKTKISTIMWTVVIALIPAAIAGVIFFKGRALVIILLSVLSAIGTEYLLEKAMKKKITCLDGSAALTGLLLALVLPPLLPFWVPVLGAIFAILIGKQIFGGLGHNIFNPALVGRAFLAASFPVFMSRYIAPGQISRFFYAADSVTSATPLTALKLDNVMNTSYGSLFLGNIGGSIGETSALALLIGAAFLFHRKIIDWRIPSAFIGTVFVLSVVFKQNTMFQLLSGGLLIGAFFMATDYVTTPITKKGKLFFGLGCGLLTITIRLFGSYPEGVMFSILIMNAASPLIDRLTIEKPFGYKNAKK